MREECEPSLLGRALGIGFVLLFAFAYAFQIATEFGINNMNDAVHHARRSMGMGQSSAYETRVATSSRAKTGFGAATVRSAATRANLNGGTY